jgi:hypothetical protein
MLLMFECRHLHPPEHITDAVASGIIKVEPMPQVHASNDELPGGALELKEQSLQLVTKHLPLMNVPSTIVSSTIVLSMIVPLTTAYWPTSQVSPTSAPVDSLRPSFLSSRLRLFLRTSFDPSEDAVAHTSAASVPRICSQEDEDLALWHASNLQKKCIA